MAKKSTLERDLESDCIELVKSKMGRMPKWTSPGNNGVPDRILLIAGVPPVFVELKAPGKGKKLRPEQTRWREWLMRNGFTFWAIDCLEDFEARLTRHLQGEQNERATSV